MSGKRAWRGARLAASSLALAALAACGTDSQAAQPSLCEQSVAAVASGARGVGLDRFDLALTSCATVEELSAALAAHPGLVRGDGEMLARDRCSTDPTPAVYQSAICDELGLGGSVPPASVDEADPEAQWLVRHLDEVTEAADAMSGQFDAVLVAPDDAAAVAACADGLAVTDGVRESAAYLDENKPLEWQGLVDVFRWAMSECAGDNLEGARGLFPELERLIAEFDTWRTTTLTR